MIYKCYDMKCDLMEGRGVQDDGDSVHAARPLVAVLVHQPHLHRTPSCQPSTNCTYIAPFGVSRPPNAPASDPLLSAVHQSYLNRTVWCQLSTNRTCIAGAPRRIIRRILEVRVVPFGTVLDFRTITSQNCKAVPMWARI